MNKEAEKIRRKELQREKAWATRSAELKRKAQETFERDLEKQLRGMKKGELVEHTRAMAHHNRLLEEERKTARLLLAEMRASTQHIQNALEERFHKDRAMIRELFAELDSYKAGPKKRKARANKYHDYFLEHYSKLLEQTDEETGKRYTKKKASAVAKDEHKDRYGPSYHDRYLHNLISKKLAPSKS